MKATLTAIQPPHTTNIFDGIKKIEWRTFKMPPGLHYVYETKRNKGSGMVIGTMQIIHSTCYDRVNDIPEFLIEAGCVSRSFLRDYAKGKKLYANVIQDAKRLEQPKPYTDFARYVEETRRLKRPIYPKPYAVYYKLGKYVSIRGNSKTIRMPPQSYLYIEIKESEK